MTGSSDLTSKESRVRFQTSLGESSLPRVPAGRSYNLRPLPGMMYAVLPGLKQIHTPIGKQTPALALKKIPS